ncbi:hypothetical protein B0A50_07899 [Salinomyces thailandicus]|uniref:Uncharacterized protein n=1 Tax=Salinomyces thailandicus TaxID=706561 RepID=A0A4U0TLT0_9PEZI|nr:hypothetical protein B0A50_07899 [Salinomyces thailandica]
MSMHMSFRAGVSLLPSQGQAPPSSSALSKPSSQDLEHLSPYEALRYQADVNCPEKLSHLLVDEDDQKTNMRLWIEILQFRQRLDGLAGVAGVWRGLRRRQIDLPTDGEEADILWQAFIRAFILGRTNLEAKDPVPDLFIYAKSLRRRTGRCYAHLYRYTVGPLFRSRPSLAHTWHLWFTKSDMLPPNPLESIAGDVVTTEYSWLAHKRFKALHRASNESNLYDTFVIRALEAKSMTWALSVHRYLIRHGDAPSQAIFERPDVQKLFEIDGNKSLPMKHHSRPPPLVSAAASHSFDNGPNHSPITRESLSTLMGQVHGIKPKEISDNFVAKMFATYAFPLNLVINGLGFFSVDKLGPVAVREMAIKAASSVEFGNSLARLRSMDIAVVDTVYTRLLQKLSAEGQSDLFHALMASDQHPEAYDDVATQEALLVEFLESGDWQQTHLTLIALELSGSGSKAAAWNRVAQQYLRLREHLLAAHTIQNMQYNKLPLSQRTMAFLHRYLLPARRRRHRPVERQRRDRPPFNALDFVTNAAMYASDITRRKHGSVDIGLATAGQVSPRLWRELLKRYGMAHRWPELERLVHWLVERFTEPRYRISGVHTTDGSGYSARKRRRAMRRRTYTVAARKTLQQGSPLPLLFDQQMQQAIVAWGIRSAAVRNSLTLKPRKEDAGYKWWQGLLLLSRLREVGVKVDLEDVRRAFWLRMIIFFGPGISRLGLNVMTRRVNQLSLEHYINTANAVWDSGRDDGKREKLVSINPELLDESNASPIRHAQLLVEFFGPYAHTGFDKEQGVHEYVDVKSWAGIVDAQQSDHRRIEVSEVQTSSTLPASAGIMGIRQAKYRQMAWARSPLRVVLGRRPVERGGAKIAGTQSSKALRHRNEAQREAEDASI